jgi:fatty acid desaturase
MLEDFQNFRKSLEDRGFFKPSYVHIVYRILELYALYSVSVAAIRYNIFLAILLFGFFGGKCGWLQHEAGHNSFTGDIKIDKKIQNIVIGFGLFVDGSMWNSMHNKHHATPQKIGHDMDLDTAPLVAFHDKVAINKFILPTKVWLKYQKYTFLPITSGIFVMLFWVLYLHPRKIIRDKNIGQGALVLAGHASRILCFMKQGNVGLYYAVLYHFLALWVSGVYLFGHFSLSHTFTPVVQTDENPSWVRYAIEHTVDIETENKTVGWIMGYLNNQVIHHLFPSMPQYRGPEVGKELRVFCKKWDIKYREVGYMEAWKLMFQNLQEVGDNISL